MEMTVVNFCSSGHKIKLPYVVEDNIYFSGPGDFEFNFSFFFLICPFSHQSTSTFLSINHWSYI